MASGVRPAPMRDDARPAARSVRRRRIVPGRCAGADRILPPTRQGQKVRAVPGAGLEVPIWLLESSLYSARVAARMGLPFAFASHFAPDYLLAALDAYRRYFTPSERLQAACVMAALNVVAAETDDEARQLFTSVQQQFINVRRGAPGRLQDPAGDRHLDLDRRGSCRGQPHPSLRHRRLATGDPRGPRPVSHAHGRERADDHHPTSSTTRPASARSESSPTSAPPWRPDRPRSRPAAPRAHPSHQAAPVRTCRHPPAPARTRPHPA